MMRKPYTGSSCAYAQHGQAARQRTSRAQASASACSQHAWLGSQHAWLGSQHAWLGVLTACMVGRAHSMHGWAHSMHGWACSQHAWLGCVLTACMVGRAQAAAKECRHACFVVFARLGMGSSKSASIRLATTCACPCAQAILSCKHVLAHERRLSSAATTCLPMRAGNPPLQQPCA